MTRDMDGATRFLESALGLRVETQEFGGGPYGVLMLDGQGVGGVSPMPPGVPAEAPAFWNVSFSVEDTDATVARAVELGGTVILEAFDMETVGRVAGLTDPFGAAFSIVSLV